MYLSFLSWSNNTQNSSLPFNPTSGRLLNSNSFYGNYYLYPKSMVFQNKETQLPLTKRDNKKSNTNKIFFEYRYYKNLPGKALSEIHHNFKNKLWEWAFFNSSSISLPSSHTKRTKVINEEILMHIYRLKVLPSRN